MNVIVCGSRYWRDARMIRCELEAVARQASMRSEPVDLLIHEGGCNTGADHLVAILADAEPRWDTKTYPADWSKLGRAAGPLRNELMVREARAAVCLAFVLTNRECRGTWDMIRRCVAAHVPVRIFSAALPEEPEPERTAVRG